MESLYLPLLALHGAFRWAVLAALLAVLAYAGISRLHSCSAPALSRLARLATVVVDIQLLLGILLYAATPLKTMVGQEGADIDIWFPALLHPLLMIIALVLAHIAKIRTVRAKASQRGNVALVWYGATLVLILAAIPWWRPFWRF